MDVASKSGHGSGCRFCRPAGSVDPRSAV